MTAHRIDLWRRLHALADRAHGIPQPLLVHADLLVARLERLLDTHDPHRKDTP